MGRRHTLEVTRIDLSTRSLSTDFSLHFYHEMISWPVLLILDWPTQPIPQKWGDVIFATVGLLQWHMHEACTGMHMLTNTSPAKTQYYRRYSVLGWILCRRVLRMYFVTLVWKQLWNTISKIVFSVHFTYDMRYAYLRNKKPKWSAASGICRLGRKCCWTKNKQKQKVKKKTNFPIIDFRSVTGFNAASNTLSSFSPIPYLLFGLR